MSSNIFTPINQVRLTNVSVVRLKKGGHRFELACYRNKIFDYRNRLTKDLDEVLQSRIIFGNVSKGQAAKDADLKKAFVAMTEDQIVLEILNKGEVQVGSEERDQSLQMLQREIASIVAEKCVNKRTGSPWPLPMVEQAMSEIHYSANLAKSAKQQVQTWQCHIFLGLRSDQAHAGKAGRPVSNCQGTDATIHQSTHC